jgi:hypothetical protein
MYRRMLLLIGDVLFKAAFVYNHTHVFLYRMVCSIWTKPIGIGHHIRTTTNSSYPLSMKKIAIEN